MLSALLNALQVLSIAVETASLACQTATLAPILQSVNSARRDSDPTLATLRVSPAST